MLLEREWRGRNSWNPDLQRSLVNKKHTSYRREISLLDLLEDALPTE